ncbi:MAG: TRAP-type C4-dicarboxylate transport system substrate-binding protein [Pseudohongiellaceae bacterium]|jgi:TRAP-type C4-dicarboxylate transport system substrate-binding protein
MKNSKFLGTVLGLMLSTSALAEKWDMPTPYGDGNHPTQVARQFAEEVTAKSGDKLNITVHSGGSLIKHPEIHRAVKSRQVQLGEVFVGRLGNNDPIFKLDNIPFLATDFDSAEKLYKLSKPELSKQLAKDGLMLLYTVPWPPQDLYSNKEVNSLADLTGLKMRAYSPTTSRLADLMGTTPVNVPFSDVAQAFTTSVIDSMITSPSTGVNNQSWDYITHFTTVNAWIPKNMVFVNQRIFDKLDTDTQQVILTAAANAEKKGWELGRENAVKDTNTLRDNGMIVTEPSTTLQDELRDIGKTMVAQWLVESGDVGKSIIDQYKK